MREKRCLVRNERVYEGGEEERKREKWRDREKERGGERVSNKE